MGDRHVRPLTFSDEIEFWKTFIRTIFDIIGNFGSIQPESFPFQYNTLFETYKFFEPTNSTPGGDRYGTQWHFRMKFNSEPLSFKQLFDIIGSFRSVQPESESMFPFQYNIIFKTYQSFETSSSVPGGDKCVLSDFCVRNLMLNNFYIPF